MSQFVTYCQEELLANEVALNYLTKDRRVSMESIKGFMLGFCPHNTRFNRDDPPEFQSLKGRITVPIFSEFGDLVGIAGRVPDKNAKGWWNTVFSKSSHLYGFNDARKHIFDKNKAYVFEGYLDRIILAQSGLLNSVAVMSASLGMRRVGLLARYCDELCLCFDTDANSAGKLGLLKTLWELQSVGFGKNINDEICRNITMIKMPVGVDPDEYVLKEGLEGFLSLEKPLSNKQMMASGAAYEELKEKMRQEKRRSFDNA